jgi:cysteinyl-tRNA synthetase
VGNVWLLSRALDEFGRDALVMYFVGGHYRQPLAFSPEALADAERRVQRVREAARRLAPGPSPQDLAPLREAFFAALAEDFNTPAALDALFRWVREANKREGVGDADLREMLGVLGLENLLDDDEAPPEEVSELGTLREAARTARDFEEADRLRDEIVKRGWEVRDTPAGPEAVRPGPE